MRAARCRPTGPLIALRRPWRLDPEAGVIWLLIFGFVLSEAALLVWLVLR